MDELLGVERRQLVDELVVAFDEVSASGSPQWWSLEAPPGWGKTRLIQELFARLASRQQGPAPYWPPTLMAEGGRPEAERKRVAPTPGSVRLDRTPEYFWLGLSCLGRPGSEFEAIVQDLRQFTMHREGLERRWRALVGLRPRLGKQLLTRRSELAETAVGEGIGLAAGALNLAVPGLGLMLLLAKWGVQHGADGGRGPGSAPITSMGRTIVEELAPELARLGGAGLPMVIVVEDAHAADETLADLLVRVVAAQASRVLLITTSWPGLLVEPERPISALQRNFQGRRVRAGEQLDDLSQIDRASMACLALPDLDQAGAELLAAKYENPFALQTACRLGAVRRSASRGTLSPELIDSLPLDAAGLYAELWQELPASVREALALAALSAPASIGTIAGLADERWDPAMLVVALASQTGLLGDVELLARDLRSAGDAYAWIRTVEALLQQFDERAHRDVALAAAETEYGPEDRQLLHAALAQVLTGADEGDLRPIKREHADRVIMALAVAGVLDRSNAGVLASARRICAGLASSWASRDLHAVLRITETVDLGNTDHIDVLGLVGFRVMALHKLGRVDEAMERYPSLVTDLTRLLGPDDPAVLAARDDHAVCLGRSGRAADAVDLLRALQLDRRRMEGSDAAGAIATSGHLATWLGQTGQFDQAIEVYAQVIEDLRATVGSAAPETLRARSNMAWWVAEDGDIRHALEIYEELLPQAADALGSDAPITMTIRSNLANWSGAAGRVDEAVDLLQVVLDDRLRVLGMDAPDTLRARGNLWWWRGERGEVEAALQHLTSVVTDRTRVLGADAPDTLKARGYVAWFKGRSGAVEDAIAEYEDLLRDQVRALGQLCPEVLETQQRLQFCRQQI